MTPVKVAVPGGAVYLAPKLTVPMGAAAMAVLNGIEPTIGPMQAALTAIYLSPAPSGGIVAWEGARFTRKGENGLDELEPITSESIERLLPWVEGGAEVAEQADALYAGDLFRPLAQRLAKSSPPTPTSESTSPSSAGGSTHPKRSRSSSPNGTAGLTSVVPVP